METGGQRRRGRQGSASAGAGERGENDESGGSQLGLLYSTAEIATGAFSNQPHNVCDGAQFVQSTSRMGSGLVP